MQQDDVTRILEKMVAADVIVLATPVYYYSMNGQMKTLIDRALPRYYTDVKISGKDFYFMATAAEDADSMERTFDGLRGFTDCLPAATVKGIVYGGGVYAPGEIRETPAFKQAYTLGKSS